MYLHYTHDHNFFAPEVLGLFFLFHLERRRIHFKKLEKSVKRINYKKNCYGEAENLNGSIFDCINPGRAFRRFHQSEQSG